MSTGQQFVTPWSNCSLKRPLCDHAFMLLNAVWSLVFGQELLGNFLFCGTVWCTTPACRCRWTMGTKTQEFRQDHALFQHKLLKRNFLSTCSFWGLPLRKIVDPQQKYIYKCVVLSKKCAKQERIRCTKKAAKAQTLEYFILYLVCGKTKINCCANWSKFVNSGRRKHCCSAFVLLCAASRWQMHTCS